MDALGKLEILNLVTRLTEEISNYIGVSDKTLAEFVLELHEQSKNVTELKEKLSQMGADFPENFVENIDRVIRQLHPKYKVSGKSSHVSKEKERVFKGLSLPDTAPVRHEEDETPNGSNVVDDALSQLTALGQKSHAQITKRKRDRDDRSPPSVSYDSKSRRDRSLDHDRDRERYRSSNDWDRQRNRSPEDDRHGRRERSPRDHRDRRHRVYSDDYQEDRDQYGKEKHQVDLDEKPIVGKIYDGQVMSVKPYGAFVTLEGIKGKVDGKACIFFFLITMSLEE